jgi:GT2 family glycosyltransferase
LLAEQYAHLTVAIATLDRPPALARCLDALDAGSMLPVEVVVVDQSSDDETERLVTRGREGVIPVRYVRQPPWGLSASRNSAFRMASEPIVAMTDDDCVPGEGWVAALAESFTAREVSAVSGRVLPHGPRRRGTYAVSSRRSTKREHFERKTPPWLAGSGGNLAVRCDVWARLGGFDERLGVGSCGQAAEDIDFIYRMLARGEMILYEPRAVVYHERQDLARRMTSRWSYGYGIGAMCGKWLRMGDIYALRLLSGWIAWRSRGLLTEMRKHRAQGVTEHRLMLRGTIAGLSYGFRLGGQA